MSEHIPDNAGIKLISKGQLTEKLTKETLAIEALEKVMSGLDCKELLRAHNISVGSENINEIKAVAALSYAWRLLGREQSIKDIRSAVDRFV